MQYFGKLPRQLQHQLKIDVQFIQFISISLFSIIKNNQIFKTLESSVRNKMEEVQLKAKAWQCCLPFTIKTTWYKNKKQT